MAKPSSRRKKKKQEVLAVKKQKLKVDMLKKTTCVAPLEVWNAHSVLPSRSFAISLLTLFGY